MPVQEVLTYPYTLIPCPYIVLVGGIILNLNSSYFTTHLRMIDPSPRQRCLVRGIIPKSPKSALGSLIIQPTMEVHLFLELLLESPPNAPCMEYVPTPWSSWAILRKVAPPSFVGLCSPIIGSKRFKML